MKVPNTLGTYSDRQHLQNSHRRLQVAYRVEYLHSNARTQERAEPTSTPPHLRHLNNTALTHRTPYIAAMAQQVLMKEFKELSKQKWVSVEVRLISSPRNGSTLTYFQLEDENVFTWDLAIMITNPDSYYYGGFFKAQMTFPKDYPYKPPGKKPGIHSRDRILTDCRLPFHPSVVAPQHLPGWSTVYLHSACSWRGRYVWRGGWRTLVTSSTC